MNILELIGKTVKDVSKRNQGFPDEGIDILFEDGTILEVKGPNIVINDSRTKAL
ncbi:hypothetical protein [Paenibacillus terrae]|uniref:hypothetical protein n=1 Tax=Paenibacillus terrae TaxID=159743 RepID=UPI000AAECEF7|nr:hypothetical protein [Paenibacillus terrae]